MMYSMAIHKSNGIQLRLSRLLNFVKILKFVEDYEEFYKITLSKNVMLRNKLICQNATQKKHTSINIAVSNFTRAKAKGFAEIQCNVLQHFHYINF